MHVGYSGKAVSLIWYSPMVSSTSLLRKFCPFRFSVTLIPVLSFLANLVATIFMLLNLNQIMSVIFNVPAAVFSSVRLVPLFVHQQWFSLTTRLLHVVPYAASTTFLVMDRKCCTFLVVDPCRRSKLICQPFFDSSTGQASTLHKGVTFPGSTTRGMQSVTCNAPSRPGVHVQVSFPGPKLCAFETSCWRMSQMETFTHQEDVSNDIFQKSKSGSDTDVETDVEAKAGFWPIHFLNFDSQANCYVL